MEVHKQKGFTLIEILVSIAVLGILSVFAVSSYGYYIAKTQIAEALVQSLKMQKEVTVEWGSNGQIPTTLPFGVINNPTKNISSVSYGIGAFGVESGTNVNYAVRILVTFSNEAHTDLKNKGFYIVGAPLGVLARPVSGITVITAGASDAVKYSGGWEWCVVQSTGNSVSQIYLPTTCV